MHGLLTHLGPRYLKLDATFMVGIRIANLQFKPEVGSMKEKHRKVTHIIDGVARNDKRGFSAWDLLLLESVFQWTGRNDGAKNTCQEAEIRKISRPEVA